MRWWDILISRTCLLILPQSVFTNCGLCCIGLVCGIRETAGICREGRIMRWLETGSVVRHITTHMAHMKPCSKLQNKRLQQRATVIIWEMCSLKRSGWWFNEDSLWPVWDNVVWRAVPETNVTSRTGWLRHSDSPGSTCVLILLSACIPNRNIISQHGTYPMLV